MLAIRWFGKLEFALYPGSHLADTGCKRVEYQQIAVVAVVW